MDTGSTFDFNSVTLYSFYDNNVKSLSDLRQNYDSSEYSIIRASDASNPIWANKYRASTEDIVQLVGMYSNVCSEADLLPRSQCPGGSGQQDWSIKRIFNTLISGILRGQLHLILHVLLHIIRLTRFKLFGLNN